MNSQTANTQLLETTTPSTIATPAPIRPEEWILRYCSITVPGRGVESLRPYPYQCRLWQDDSRQRIVLKSRQMGVSRALACEAVYSALNNPGATVLFVSRSLQAARNLLRYAWQSIQPAVLAGDLPRPTRRNTTSLEWESLESRIVSLAASIDAARSYAATAVYLDEAAYLPWAEEIYQSLAPTVSTGGRITVVSTPHGRGNLFHRLWVQASPGAAAAEDGAAEFSAAEFSAAEFSAAEFSAAEYSAADPGAIDLDGPSALPPGNGAAKCPGPRPPAPRGGWSLHRVHWSERPEYTPAWAETERRRHTMRSWAEEYELSFEESGQSVFQEAHLQALLMPAGVKGAARAPVPPFFAGLDLARYADYTALAILDSEGWLVGLVRFNQAGWTIQVERVAAALSRFPGVHVVCDATGAGDPVFGMLQTKAASTRTADRRAKQSWTTEPFVYTAESRGCLIDEFVLAVEAASLRIPQDPASTLQRGAVEILLGEMRTFQWINTPSGKAIARHPAGCHDDCIQALSLAWKGLSSYRAKRRPLVNPLVAVGTFQSPLHRSAVGELW